MFLQPLQNAQPVPAPGTTVPISPESGGPRVPQAVLRNETPSASGVPGSVPSVPAGCWGTSPWCASAPRKVCWLHSDTRAMGPAIPGDTNHPCHHVPALLHMGGTPFQGWQWDLHWDFSTLPVPLCPGHQGSPLRGGLWGVGTVLGTPATGRTQGHKHFTRSLSWLCPNCCSQVVFLPSRAGSRAVVGQRAGDWGLGLSGGTGISHGITIMVGSKLGWA